MVHDFYNGTELPALKGKYVCEFYENNRRRVDIRCPLIGENRTLEHYGYEAGNMVQFSSRYMAEESPSSRRGFLKLVLLIHDQALPRRVSTTN